MSKNYSFLAWHPTKHKEIEPLKKSFIHWIFKVANIQNKQKNNIKTMENQNQHKVDYVN